MTKPIFSTEEHRVTGWSLFVAREQIKRPVGYAVRAIRPAKLKRQIKKRLYQLQFSLGQLREYLEAEVAAREIDPCTACDLYYRPNHVKPHGKCPRCLSVQTRDWRRHLTRGYG
jgi:predicted Zn-ribbon and HTH transcriptional regulator